MNAGSQDTPASSTVNPKLIGVLIPDATDADNTPDDQDSSDDDDANDPDTTHLKEAIQESLGTTHGSSSKFMAVSKSTEGKAEKMTHYYGEVPENITALRNYECNTEWSHPIASIS